MATQGWTQADVDKANGKSSARKPSKMMNVETITMGKKFSSKKESNRFVILFAEQQAGDITELECQPVFDIYIDEFLICRYIADFRYKRNGEVVVEDVKGRRAGAAWEKYRIKNKLMKAVLKINIVEI